MRKGAGIIIAALGMLQAMPLAAQAAEADCTVEVTVRTEETVLNRAEVSVGDENGDGRMTVEDVLIAAHEKYYEGGAEAGYQRSCADAPEVSKIWGVRGRYISFILDAEGNEKTGAPADGDKISVLLQDGAKDSYRFRHGPLHQIPVGEHVNLKLVHRRSENGRDEPVSDAVILIDGRRTAIRTDEKGFAAVSFRDPGVHTLSAKLNGSVLLEQNEEITVVERNEETDAVQNGQTAQTETTPAGTEADNGTATVSGVLGTTVSAALTKLAGVSAGESAPLAAFCGAGAVAIAAALICSCKKSGE
ncbi:MAG: hypothetical protein IKH27_05450 [Oscillospiraceae bacterium]|nr:hypothetical protein [Oscillospiraceae bacterium]